MLTEKQAAQILTQIEGFGKSVATLTDRIKNLQTESEEFKKLDIKAILDEVELLKASNERIVSAIKHNKRGLYVPGLEDATDKFSMIRAVHAVQTRNWDGAGFEKECLEAAREKMALLKASHVIGDDQLGGYFVPDQLIPEVIGAIYTQSQFISLSGDDGTTRVTVIDNLVGGNVKLPKFDGGLIAYWIGEEDAYTESATSVGDLSLKPKKLGVLIRLTQEMRNFAGFGFESLIRRDMVRAISKKLDYAIPFGRGGDNMPLGIFNTAGVRVYSAQKDNSGSIGDDLSDTTEFQADWDGADVAYKELGKMQLALEEDDIVMDDSATWFASPRFWNRLKEFRIPPAAAVASDERREFVLGAPMISDARLAEAIGKFAKANQFPTTNDPGESVGAPTTNTSDLYGDLLYGNMNEVLLGRWSGIQIEDDSGRGLGFVTDHIYVKMRMWVDVGIRQPRGLIVCPDVKVRDA